MFGAFDKHSFAKLITLAKKKKELDWAVHIFFLEDCFPKPAELTANGHYFTIIYLEFKNQKVLTTGREQEVGWWSSPAVTRWG